MTEERLRPPTMADAARVTELANARAEALGSPTRSTIEDIESWWESSGVDLSADMVLADDAHERIRGFAFVTQPGKPYVAVHGGAIVHPDAFECDVLWDELHTWVYERAKAHVPLAPSGAQVSLFTEAIEQDERKKAAIARAGYALARVFYRMRMDLDVEIPAPAIPEGIILRTMRPDELADVAEVHVEAFRDHWGHADESAEEFAGEWLESTKDQCPDFSCVAISDGGIVGYALCEDRYRGDSGVGHIVVLGVRTAYRGRGIASALLRTVFRAFRAAGYSTVRLGVDASSPTGATRLYEKAGMVVIEQINRYEQVLRSGRDLLTRGREN